MLTGGIANKKQNEMTIRLLSTIRQQVRLRYNAANTVNDVRTFFLAYGREMARRPVGLPG